MLVFTVPYTVIPYSGKLSRDKTFANFHRQCHVGNKSMWVWQSSISPFHESFLPQKFPAISWYYLHVLQVYIYIVTVTNTYSLQAYKDAVKNAPNPPSLPALSEYTSDQLFFIAFGQVCVHLGTCVVKLPLCH